MPDVYHCTVDGIDLAMERLLSDYAAEVDAIVTAAVQTAADEMVADTKASAPVDGGKWEPAFKATRRGGTFRSRIRWKGFPHIGGGYTATWYVSGSEYRLTHLLEHGHELFIFGKPTGKRTEAAGFVLEARNRAEANLMAMLRGGLG